MDVEDVTAHSHLLPHIQHYLSELKCGLLLLTAFQCIIIKLMVFIRSSQYTSKGGSEVWELKKEAKSNTDYIV